MKFKLTDKIQSYAPKGLRERFSHGCKWLGTVVVDDGRRGALMMTPEGNYVMVQSYNRTASLNPERAALAMAEAMTPPPEKIKRPSGRPPTYGERMITLTVQVPRHIYEACAAEGNGVTPVGARRVLLAGIEALSDERR